MMPLRKNLAVLAFTFAQFAANLAYPDAVFVQRPQNLTIFNLKEPFFFNCSTHVASDEGMDWLVRIGENLERICSSKDFYDAGSSSCQLNYSMEVPNNRTLNLIVDPRIARLGNEYCCQFNNGAGKRSCSYLTISPQPTSTADPEFVDTTTVTRHNTAAASSALPANAGLIAGVVVGITVVLLVTIALIFLIRKYRSDRRESSGGSNGTELETAKKLIKNGHSSKASP